MNPSARGVFLTTTDLLGKRSFMDFAPTTYTRISPDDCSAENTDCTQGCLLWQPGDTCALETGQDCVDSLKCYATPQPRTDFSTMLSHVSRVWAVNGQGGFGCIWIGPIPTCCSDNGGGENNRIFFSADDQLKGYLRNLGFGLPGWRSSNDPAGPHGDFNVSRETNHGQPRGQAHFWAWDHEARVMTRPGVAGVYDPNLVELDLDYNLCHDSNPDGYYGGTQGRQLYESVWWGQGFGGSAEYDYVPGGCSISPQCTTGQVSFGQRGVRFTAGGGLQSADIATTAACAWTAASQASWLAVTPSSGTGTRSITATASASSGRARISGIDAHGGELGALQDGAWSPFTDVPIGHPFATYVDILQQWGITAGCGAGLYCPDAEITRAQMAIFVIRAIYGGDSFPYPTTPYFADVPPGSFGFAHIQKLRELGITGGCSATTYCPGASVTRGQAAVFLVRAVYGNSFSFSPLPYFTDVPASHYWFSFIQKMRDLGITAGCSTTGYCPDAPVTRGQMAVFVVRMFGSVP